MDSLYSMSLLVAFAAGIVALILAMSLFIKRPRPQPHRLLSFWHAILAIIAICVVAMLVSLAAHLLGGHRPGSSQALGVMDFFAVHPAYLVVAVLPLAAAVLAWWYCRKQGAERHDGSSRPDA